MIRGGLRALLGLALVVAIVACEGGEVIVFSPAQGLAGNPAGAGGAVAGSSAGLAGTGGSAPGGSSGTGGNPLDRVCQSNDDCDPSWFCQKQECSEPAGVCSPIPILDDSRLLPVCGCDHITYWNDSLRQVARVSAAQAGPCGADALPCMSGDECGPFGACRQFFSNVADCGMQDGSGQCWAIPNDCASADDAPVYVPCPPPPGSPPPDCLTMCQALQSDLPYLLAPRKFDCGP
jgi:hypothetical protein